VGKKVHAALERWARFRDSRESVAAELFDLEAQVGPRRFKASVLLDWLEQQSFLDYEGVSEWPFEWDLEGVSLVGALDRVINLDGSLVVMDYKVFSALKSKELVLELYAFQLELYAAAVVGAFGLERCQGLRAMIVQIAPEGVDMVEVPIEIDKLLSRAKSIARRAQTLVTNPDLGEKNPTRRESCRICPHARNCDVSVLAP
jgi:hypothetical protein